MLATHSTATERPAPQPRTWGMWPPLESPNSPSDTPAIEDDPSSWPRSANIPFPADVVNSSSLMESQSSFHWASGAASTQEEAISSSNMFALRQPTRAMTEGHLDTTSGSLLESSLRGNGEDDDDDTGEGGEFWRPAATVPSSPDARSLGEHSQTPSPASENGTGWRAAHYSHDELYRALPANTGAYEQERPVASTLARWDTATAGDVAPSNDLAAPDTTWNEESSEEPVSPLADANDGRLLVYAQVDGFPIARRMTEGDFRNAEERYRSAATGFEYRASDAGLSYTSNGSSTGGLPLMAERSSIAASPVMQEPLTHSGPYHYQGIGTQYGAAAMHPGSASTSTANGWSTGQGQGSYVPSSHGPTVPSSTYHFSNGLGNVVASQGWSSGAYDQLRSSAYGGISYSTGLYSGHGMSSIYPYFPIVKHRRRTTKEQFIKLEGQFRENPKPSSAVRKALSKQVGMTDRAVQIWFQNRRAKAKALAKKQAAEEAAKKNSVATAAGSSSTSSCHPMNNAMAYNDDRSQGQLASASTSCSVLRLQAPSAPPSDPSSSPYQRFHDSIYHRRP